MKIMVSMAKSLYQESDWIGEPLLKNGFIHATTPELAYRIKDKFKGDMIQIWIDTDKLLSPVLFEDKNNNKLFYPHIYGLINKAAIIDISPLTELDIINQTGHYKGVTYIKEPYEEN